MRLKVGQRVMDEYSGEVYTLLEFGRSTDICTGKDSEDVRVMKENGDIVYLDVDDILKKAVILK